MHIITHTCIYIIKLYNYIVKIKQYLLQRRLNFRPILGQCQDKSRSPHFAQHCTIAYKLYNSLQTVQ